MSARKVKALSFNGAKNRKHREHTAAKTRSPYHNEQRNRRVRKELKRQEFEAEDRASFKDFKKRFNTDEGFRRYNLSVAKQKRENNN